MLDVLSIGNAIVDLIADIDEKTLAASGLTKGGMMLVDEEKSVARQKLVEDSPLRKASGGSAANTAAVIASLGGNSGYIGKVSHDAFGKFFRSDMTAAGVNHHDHSLTEPNKPTAHCLAMITPDGERTMSTFLGACQELSIHDVSIDLINNSQLVFLEGYLLDSPRSAAALIYAAEMAIVAGAIVAITLFDKYCVQRNRPAFDMLVESGLVHIVIGNEREVQEFTGVSDVEDCVGWKHGHRIKLVVTLGKQGAAVIKGGMYLHRPSASVRAVVDLVGAGDAFAGGFLYGQACSLPDADCLEIGNRAAAVVVESRGARPHTPLKELLFDGQSASLDLADLSERIAN